MEEAPFITNEITNSELMEDELDCDIETFNRQIVVPGFNRAVLEEIARDIDPENPNEKAMRASF
jgi:type I restriction enzyme R subunit